MSILTRESKNAKGQISIFRRYYSKEKFIDRYLKEPGGAVDVIIPLIHTNELWGKNLISFYREIPINRLLIGDGGCVDNSLKIARKFPRVKIYNHTKYRSLGYSIRKLIEKVETKWFVYLHTDVYLPKGWFKNMNRYRGKYDWFQCRQHITILADYLLYTSRKALSGSQMGRKAAFRKVLPGVKDDYLYRIEDVILAELVEQNGFRYGKAEDVFHYHQVMNKASRWKRKIRDIIIEKAKDEEQRECIMQVKATIKYLNPDSEEYRRSALGGINQMQALGILNRGRLLRWVKKTNPKWLSYVQKILKETTLASRFKRIASGSIRRLLKILE
ncbi:hypothetical protein KJ912_01025 [Patescibacteria group bacterium]|nr:hypothetical protein [Patescibacteria group bacterium]